MKEKLLIFLSCFFLSMSLMLAQTSRVSGTVYSADDGEPVAGASVLVKGSATAGTSTDTDGKFTISNVPAGSKVLVVSFVGMETQEVSIKGGNLKIYLKDDTKALDEYVVVAYGTQKKSSFAGAAATISTEKIENQQVSNISKALEGQVAGVQIASSTGTPGSSASIIIRGLGSISADQTPLIVVDGVPYEGSLNSIPTQDIETLNVLKDAAANSMYGARGSNGVIMITTKNGKTSGKPVINFDARYGFNARGVGNYDIVTDAGEYYELAYESIRNALVSEMGYAGASKYASKNLISSYLKYNKFKGVADDQLIDPLTGKLNPAAKEYKWNDDWTKDPFENGTRQEYNVNIAGGNEKTQAYASLGYLKDEGYMAGSGFERVSARVKVDQKITDFIKAGGNIAYSNTQQKLSDTSDGSGNYSNIFFFSQAIAPIYPIYLYDNDGNRMYDALGNTLYDFGQEYGRPYSSDQNPLAVAKENLNEVARDNLSSRGYLEIKFLKDFKFTLNVAYDVFNTNETYFATPIGGDAANVGGRGYRYSTRYGALNVNQLVNWNRKFGKHGANVLLGHETKNDENKYFYGHMTNFADKGNADFSNATQYQDLTSYTTEYALEGYFVQGNYDYADKYYLTASYRRDGSSRFHKDNRWGDFWAVGGAWRIKEESFLRNVREISALKLKMSYGTQGNDNVGYAHNYADLYRVDRVDGEAAFTKVLRGNKDLTWEKSRNFNAGFELGLLDRINLNFDFFVKETKDMLYYSPLASSEGAPTGIYRNEMDMKNTGFEVELSANLIKNRFVKWDMSLNMTHYKNELTKLPASKPASEFPDGYQAGSYWRKKGGSLYDWYTYEYVGVDSETGLPQYNKYVTEDVPVLDAEGNPTYDADGNALTQSVEKIEIVNTTSEATLRQTGKSAIPDVTGGISTSIECFGFDLSVSGAFQLGGYVWDSQYASLMGNISQGCNVHKDMLNRWTPSHTETNVPIMLYGNQSYTMYGDCLLTDASYFSLRNVTLGYTVPTRLVKSAGISKLRVYLTGDNIWLQSKRKGLDPRQSFSGSTAYVYSALSTYSVGVNLTF